VLVLRTRVVEVLCSENERSEENPVDSATHTLRDGRKLSLKPGKIYERAHKSWDLHPGSVNKRCDEDFKGR
jgi:hypothetical protein